MHAKMHHMLHAKIMRDHMNAFVMMDTLVTEHIALMLMNVPPEMTVFKKKPPFEKNPSFLLKIRKSGRRAVETSEPVQSSTRFGQKVPLLVIARFILPVKILRVVENANVKLVSKAMV